MTPAGDSVGRAAAFGRYAAWYDAFNQGKDYDAEIRYVLRRIADFTDPPKRWLDIGCGTGHHLACLHARGIAAEGLELSPTMAARARLAHPQIPLHVGSAQDFRLEGSRDVISMLFHVMSYQVSNVMVRSALKGIARHLAPAGVLVFDFWNSEAVLRDPPVRRVREAQVDGRPLFRLSTPSETSDRRRVDVRFQFRWDSPEGPVVHEELHALRHFTGPELETLLREVGMTVLTCDGWMCNHALSPDDWYGFICARQEPPRS